MDDNYILDKIKRLLEEKGMTYYRLAKISGLSVSSLRNTMRYSYQPIFGTLDKICNGLGITLSQFFAEDGCYPDLTEEQECLLKVWDSLSYGQKKVFETFLKGLIFSE